MGKPETFMRSKKYLVAMMALFSLFFSQTLLASDSDQKLFVNLSSDELNRAAMAISFSTRVLTEKKIPVTIFLNVDAVRIADKNIPENKHASGKSLKEMLVTFMDGGGKVIACPMCIKNVGGMTKDDLINGINVGSSDVTWPALFAEDTTVLSY